MTELTYMIAWFVLPLIPAFVLFRFLPSTGRVSGPLKGLEIKFGGAFAGYLILFLVSYNVMKGWIKKSDEIREVWTIRGNISSDDGKFSAWSDKPSFVIDPKFQRFQSKEFDVQVIVTSDLKGYLTFPMIALTALGYTDEDLPSLGFNKKVKNIDTTRYVFENYDSRIIRLKDAVFLRNNQPVPLNGNVETLATDTTTSNN